MKKITLLLLLTLSVFGAKAQTVYQLNYDSIRVGKTTGAGAISNYGKFYLKNVSTGLGSDSILTVRNGRVFKIGAVTSVDSTVFRTVANSVSLSGLQTRLNDYVTITTTQTISGTKTFSANNTRFEGTASANAFSVIVRNTDATGFATHRLYNDQNSGTRSLQLDYAGSSYAGTLMTGAAVGESAGIKTTGAYPLYFGTNGALALTLGTSQQAIFSGALSGTTASFNGKISSTVGNNTIILENTSPTTGYIVGTRLVNTGGIYGTGLENSSGGDRYVGSTAYAAYLASYSTAPVEIAVNNNKVATFGNGGDLTVVRNISAANLSSGTYTPTLTNGANVTSSSVTGVRYSRVGNEVTVILYLTITPTATGTPFQVNVSLPFASNFTNIYDANGGRLYNLSAADTATDTLIADGQGTAGVAQSATFTYFYIIK